jgi:hypothetical protein
VGRDSGDVVLVPMGGRKQGHRAGRRAGRKGGRKGAEGLAENLLQEADAISEEEDGTTEAGRLQAEFEAFADFVADASPNDLPALQAGLRRSLAGLRGRYM